MKYSDVKEGEIYAVMLSGYIKYLIVDKIKNISKHFMDVSCFYYYGCGAGRHQDEWVWDNGLMLKGEDFLDPSNTEGDSRRIMAALFENLTGYNE